VCDATSGFKLARVRNFVERLPLSEDVILSRLHAYKIHLLYSMHRLGAKTIEIPITFRERRNGSSKSTILDIFESLKVVGILRLRQLIGDNLLCRFSAMKWRGSRYVGIAHRSHEPQGSKNNPSG
jgi:hypothetical protein